MDTALLVIAQLAARRSQILRSVSSVLTRQPKGSAGPEDGHPTPKGSGKQGQAKGSTKSDRPEEHTPKGSGKQLESKTFEPGRTQTCNLWFPRPTPYPPYPLGPRKLAHGKSVSNF